MDLSWSATATPSANGNVFLKSFDVEKYDTLFAAFTSLDGSEKKNYKGAEDYIVQQGGPSLSPEERNYKKYIDEMSTNVDQ